MNKPIISINIPCYNRSEMLKECIELFINQTFENWELIVIDDGSIDDLTFVVDMDKRIRYIRQLKKGQATARNLAIRNSHGKYILQFDSDDLPSSPIFLEKMLAVLKKDPSYDAIYSDYYIIRENGNKGIVKLYAVNEDEYKTMLSRQYVPNAGTLWKRESIPMYDETLESAIDLELMLTALERGVKFRHLNKRLWTLRAGHPRETGTKIQEDCCDRILRKRGYYFDREKREGFKIK